jgi:hypothetical protein
MNWALDSEISRRKHARFVAITISLALCNSQPCSGVKNSLSGMKKSLSGAKKSLSGAKKSLRAMGTFSNMLIPV